MTAPFTNSATESDIDSVALHLIDIGYHVSFVIVEGKVVGLRARRKSHQSVVPKLWQTVKFTGVRDANGRATWILIPDKPGRSGPRHAS